jgi:excisionase family DNA binding protein
MSSQPVSRPVITPAELPRYVSTTDAAKIVGMNSATVRDWIRAGRLPAYRVGGRVTRIAVADLLGMFEALGPDSRVQPAPPAAAASKAARDKRKAAAAAAAAVPPPRD